MITQDASGGACIVRFQVVSLPVQSTILEVANFCAVMATLVDQDGVHEALVICESCNKRKESRKNPQKIFYYSF